MELTAVSGVLKRVLDAGIQKIFSTEGLKNILEKLIQALKEPAEKTENPFDDWAVNFLESVVLDDGKMKILSDFIRGKLANLVKCEVAPKKRDEYGELAAELTTQEDHVYEGTVSWVSIAQLLQIVVPILVDFFAKKEVNQTSKVA
ncbi:MAG: hypothetical protein Q4D38_14930 [Planctomycetia bacterium]|nr:hypothetical protein [Planctomycetia bacterium]